MAQFLEMELERLSLHAMLLGLLLQYSTTINEECPTPARFLATLRRLQ